MQQMMDEPHYKARILVVEDEVIVARDIQQQLRELGYEPIAHTTRAEEAIALAESLSPDVILMDIQLAGAMDGITAAQIIRTQLALPVVFITAFEADDILARAKLTEPFGYILKPFAERELRTVLEMALYKHRVEREQREAALHHQAIIDHMVDSLITINAQGIMESFNQAACDVFGYSVEEAIGQNVSLLMPEPHHSLHDQYLQHHYETGDTRIIGSARELEGRRKDGSLFPMSLSVSKVVRGGRTTFIGIIRDITQRRQDEQEINRLAFYDPLTQLPNRRLFLDRLQQAMLTAGRNGQYVALMFLDLDHFKLLNDSLGHSVGDELLRQVAARLQGTVRDGDSVARLGGDEFVILMEGLSDSVLEAAVQAEHLAMKLITELAQPYMLPELHNHSTVSIGITLFCSEQESLGDLLKKADAAMYQAKKAGRNTLRFFDPTMQATALARSRLERSLRTALENQEFLLHYQIQVDAFGTVTGVEALVRWSNPSFGMVSPATFIPLAEETGVILSLGQWVLETACAQLAAWAKVPARAHWTMAVNVSISQFAQGNFVDNVDLALRNSGANPRLLKLEITESMLAANVDDVVVKMFEVKALGVAFSLDDFGTGYSSLSYLKRLPLDQLKIDQSFVRDLMTDPNDAIIAKTIIALAHNLGLNVIAEGVETLEQKDYLADMGCNAYQGYYFGRPLAIAALEAAHPISWLNHE